MASKQSTCWVIEHPEIGTAFVVADSWEQATVRAAEFWGVSWARTVSGMELVRRKLTAALPDYDHIWEGEIDGTLSVYIGDGVLGAAVQVLD